MLKDNKEANTRNEMHHAWHGHRKVYIRDTSSLLFKNIFLLT